MPDQIEHICGSRVQHGHHNDRVYVMRLDPAASQLLIPELDRLAVENRYGKITAKIPAFCWNLFRAAGYHREAVVPGLFNGHTAGLFVAKFFSPRRRIIGDYPAAAPKPRQPRRSHAKADWPVSIMTCTPADANALGGIYSQVFNSYPVPIHQPRTIRQMMRDNVTYACARTNQRMVAAAAAETDTGHGNCEMTDFATLPAYRGNRLAQKLLARLQNQARHRHLKTAYTIARADSIGMNRVFEKCGYRFAGRLVKNTQIGGRIRSMHVWYRHL